MLNFPPFVPFYTTCSNDVLIKGKTTVSGAPNPALAALKKRRIDVVSKTEEGNKFSTTTQVSTGSLTNTSTIDIKIENSDYIVDGV
jgi:hypothetical protein